MSRNGHDTTFANAALAYRMLSETYQRIVAGLRMHFSLRDVLQSVYDAVEVRDTPLGRLAATRDAPALSEDLLRKIRGSAHPMVRTHPVTGEKSLYLDPSYGIGIEGMSREESYRYWTSGDWWDWAQRRGLNL